MKQYATRVMAVAMTITCGWAAAQSNVTIYGVADAGFVHESGGAAGSVDKISSGVGSGSRLGFKGKEDLGGGVAAFFQLENGYNIDTGSAGQGGLLFGRQAYVGLSSTALGTVTLGRQYSPLYATLRDVVDPFEIGLSGNVLNIIPGYTRVDNMVQYASPRLAGFSADLAYGAGESAVSSKRNRQWGASVRYVANGLNVTLSKHSKNDTLAKDAANYTMLVAKYKFGAFSVDLARGIDRGLAGARANDTVLGATATQGANTVLASYIVHDDTRSTNRDARQWALGYLYALSKRTDLYASYGHIANRNGALYTVGNGTESGSGNAATNIGVRHRF